MEAEQIRTPWDEQILELEEIKDFAISWSELQHPPPKGLRVLSYMAEGYRQGYEAGRADTEERYKKLVGIAEEVKVLASFPNVRRDRLTAALAKAKGEAHEQNKHG